MLLIYIQCWIMNVLISTFDSHCGSHLVLYTPLQPYMMF